MLSAVVERLKLTVTDAPDVIMAEDLDAIIQSLQRDSGTIFVIPFRERAKANSLATSYRQLINEQFLVAVLLRHHGDELGTMKAKLFSPVKRGIERALAGWEPDDNTDPLELVGGEGTPIGNGVTVYIQTWETNRLLTQED
ncbi:phage tail terminator protein [Ochrobactrum chromiisoli]|uniref:TPM domain-containing protein n=1 Tax=Ochrobactrum chromiisoli TaxID=2993941 RepID=A0ABT3QN99_9HYPH|nr:hypothetical protein [Ochrobactrum chromiisoli]MCX2697071.1 hypothetical protein [Ochrobactrum chromiisoli]